MPILRINPATTDRLRIWLYGALLASAACAHFPLMYAYRSVWTSKFSTYTKSWPSDGRFSQIGMYGMDEGDTTFAAPVVREFSHHLRPRDPYALREGSAIPLDYIPFRALGGLFWLTGDINATWLLARFIACLLWFVLLFHTARLLSIPQSGAVFCAAFCTCFSYVMLLNFRTSIYWSGGLLKTALHAIYSIALIGRTEGVWRLPRPGFTHIGLFAATLIWGRTADSRKILPWVLAGIGGGLLAYVRIDVWSAYCGAACLFPLLQAALLRRWEWRWVLPAALTLALGFPTLVFVLHPPEEFMLLASMDTGGGVDWMSLPYLPFAAWMLHRRKDVLTVFFAALLLASLLICNAGVITGRSLYTLNWHHFCTIYMFIFSISALPRRWLDRHDLWKTAAAVCVGASLLINIGYAGVRYPWHGLPSSYDEAFRWLDAHAQRDSVVAALSPEANALIPCFTPLKTLTGATASITSTISTKEVIERIIFAFDIMGGDPKSYFKKVLIDSKLSTMRYSLDRVAEDSSAGYPHYFGHYPKSRLQEKIDAALKVRPPKSFPVNYVWVGPFERLWLSPRFPANAPMPLHRVFSNGVVDLYRVD